MISFNFRLAPPDLRKRSAKSMVDCNTSFFRLTDKLWRLVRDDLRLDVYVEVGKNEVFVDGKSFDYWRDNPFAFPENSICDESDGKREVSDLEKDDLIGKLKWYFFGKFGLPVRLT